MGQSRGAPRARQLGAESRPGAQTVRERAGRRKHRQAGPTDQSHLAELRWEERPSQVGGQPCQPRPAAPGVREAEQLQEPPIFTPLPPPVFTSMSSPPEGEPPIFTPPPPDFNSMSSQPEGESELGLKIVSIETMDMITWLSMDSLIEGEKLEADGTASEPSLQITKVETVGL